jgi:hypothetical protein
MRALVLAALLVCGCQNGGGKDVRLDGSPAEAFRRLIRHDAITLSEKVAIYGVEAPPGSQVVCHEEAHKRQAKVIADALVSIGAIDDDELSRAAAWLALYAIDAAQYGYAGNRWEKGARAACP